MALLGFLQSFVAPVVCSVPAHLLCFSSLLGTQLHQTFVITKVCFQVLPRPSFVRLQRQIFPVYFRIQSILLLFTALTYPPFGPLSLAQHKSDWVPLLVGGWSALLNLFLFGPRTRQAMIDRSEQGPESRGKDDEYSGHLGVGLAAVKRRFSKNHAASIHLNLITVIATLWHGWRLATRLNF